MSDPQASTLYKWEDSFTTWAGSRFSDDDMVTAVRKACRMYRVKAPTVVFHNVDKLGKEKAPSCYIPSTNTIAFRPRHNNLAVALHEAAHAIVDSIFGSTVADHGPEYLGVYMVLLERFQIAPRSALEASAEERGLKWLEQKHAEPGKVRAYARRKRK